jgi:hypothetical protein
MKRDTLMLAALAVTVSLSVAQARLPRAAAEPPPVPTAPKREGKVSPEAKACIEAIGKAMYSPIPIGLKRLEGTMLSIEGSRTEAATVDFRAPAELVVKDVERTPPNLVEKGATESSTVRAAKDILLESLGLQPVPSELANGPYDAEVAEQAGVRVLVVKTGPEVSLGLESRYTLDAAGLPVSGTGTWGTAPGPIVKFERSFEYVSEGSRFLLKKDVKRFPEASTSFFTMSVEIMNTYLDVGGLKLWVERVMNVPLGGPVTYRWRELSVNGAKIDLATGKPAKDDGPRTDGKDAPAPKEK